VCEIAVRGMPLDRQYVEHERRVVGRSLGAFNTLHPFMKDDPGLGRIAVVPAETAQE
jgi:hypothetical protein